MLQYAIEFSPLTGIAYIGTKNKAGTEWVTKQEVDPKMQERFVMEYLTRQIWAGKGMIRTLKNKNKVKVEIIRPETWQNLEANV